jgi:hypothetical protein
MALSAIYAYLSPINIKKKVIMFVFSIPIAIICLCDHFETLWEKASFEKGLSRVRAWHEKYPRIADKLKMVHWARGTKRLSYN